MLNQYLWGSKLVCVRFQIYQLGNKLRMSHPQQSLSSPHLQQNRQFYSAACQHQITEIPVHPRPQSYQTLTPGGDSAMPTDKAGTLNSKNRNNIEGINNEYMMLRNRVESRIKQLEEKCLAEDPSRTRITLNMQQEGEYGDDRWKTVEGLHSPGNNLPHCYGPMPNWSSHTHCHHQRTSMRCNTCHAVKLNMQVKECQGYPQHHGCHRLEQLPRPHCYSSSSNTSPYHVPPSESAQYCNNLTDPSSQQHPKIKTGYHLNHSEPAQNAPNLPLYNNGSNSNTLLNQNISEAIWENLKYQKQISTNLKTLSEKLSDFSVKRSESSGFLEENYHKNKGIQRQAVADSRQKKHNLIDGFRENGSSREYGGCWECSQNSSSLKNNTQYQRQPSKQYNDRHSQKYADEGYDSSSEEEPNQKISRYTPNEIGAIGAHANKQRKETQQLNEKQPTIRKKKSIFYPSYGRDNFKNSSKLSHSQSRAKSASNCSVLKNKGLNTFQRIKKSVKHRQKAGVKGPKNAQTKKHFHPEYFALEKADKPQPNTKKLEQNIKNSCPLHATNFILELYQNRQKNKMKQVYKDSQHRNRKHEKDHMIQSFQQQQKLRKQLLAKISKNFFSNYGVK